MIKLTTCFHLVLGTDAFQATNQNAMMAIMLDADNSNKTIADSSAMQLYKGGGRNGDEEDVGFSLYESVVCIACSKALGGCPFLVRKDHYAAHRKGPKHRKRVEELRNSPALGPPPPFLALSQAEVSPNV